MPHPKYDVLGKVPSDWEKGLLLRRSLRPSPADYTRVVWGMNEHGRQGKICLILV